ncbi:hypothetical protein BV898_18546 [Hypsibius exemplaris]|uniref:Uncharacterized protein n=1 Tax=Hypsibius exemplaris TaxID=2072580 RepID=A0A9X6NK67_HYPEX|nr:hypothetical protein BV898_18546 [Hypsibius exemplaris]
MHQLKLAATQECPSFHYGNVIVKFREGKGSNHPSSHQSEKEEDIPSKKEVKNVNKRGLPFIRSDSLIKKVVKAIDTPNPPPNVKFPASLGISTGTVSRVLKEDLGLTYHKKVTTHVLTPKQAQQRLDRGPTFYAVSAVENFL